MRKHFLIPTFFFLLQFAYNSANAQSIWIQKANYGGPPTTMAVGFSIGNYGYIGTGDSYTGVTDSLWQYDPSSNIWVAKTPFPGTPRKLAVGFSLGNYGYIGTGIDAGTNGYCNDFQRYNPSSNTWSSIAPIPGARCHAVAFTIQGSAYVGMGYSNLGGYLNDFYKYDTTSNTWSSIASFPLAGRESSIGFSINGKGYVMCGFNNLSSPIDYNDCWEYNPTTNSWVAVASLPAPGRWGATGFSIGNYGYLGLGNGMGAFSDFLKYDPVANTWTLLSPFPGGQRNWSTSFVINSCAYLGTGSDSLGTYDNHFWETCNGVAGTEENYSSQSVLICPNPFSTQTTLTFANPTHQNCTLTLFDLHGQIVRTIRNITADKVEIERQSLSCGLYFFQLRTEKQIIATGKLMIE